MVVGEGSMNVTHDERSEGGEKKIRRVQETLSESIYTGSSRVYKRSKVIWNAPSVQKRLKRGNKKYPIL